LYTPDHFRVDDFDKLRALMRQNSFATLITSDAGSPFATHLPFLVDDGGQYGVLRGHIAHVNPHWKHFDGREALVIFQGPHAYISPRWYANPNLVPTWNYAVVHAYGRPKIVDNTALDDILRRTVAQYEPDSDEAWNLDSLAVDFVDKLKGAIVGFDMEITRLEGKFKMSQNRSKADQAGAIDGLRAAADPLSIAVAEWMETELLAERSDG
jgi:transcriptional regulator